MNVAPPGPPFAVVMDLQRFPVHFQIGLLGQGPVVVTTLLPPSVAVPTYYLVTVTIANQLGSGAIGPLGVPVVSFQAPTSIIAAVPDAIADGASWQFVFGMRRDSGSGVLSMVELARSLNATLASTLPP